MSTNTILTTSMVAKEAVMLFENSTPFVRSINREYDDKFAQTGAKIGYSIAIRNLPQSYTVTNSASITPQNYAETQLTLTLSNQSNVPVSFSSADLTMSMDDFSDRVLKPAITSLANYVEAGCLQTASQSVYSTYGTPGTANTSAAGYLNAAVYLDNFAAPRDGQWSSILSPQAQADIVGGLTNLYNPGKTISEQTLTGEMGEAFGVQFRMSQNVYGQTNGALTGTITVNGGSQTGTTLALTGFATSTSNVLLGFETFTVAGVYSLNPITGTKGKLQYFVNAGGAVNSNGSGQASVTIAPAITPGVTVNASPAGGAAVTFVGTGTGANASFPISLIYHKNFQTFGSADLIDISKYGAWCARMAHKKTGTSIRIAEQYTINNDQVVTRCDILWGSAVLRPQWGVRVVGSNT